jgi:hypothetical protein
MRWPKVHYEVSRFRRHDSRGFRKIPVNIGRHEQVTARSAISTAPCLRPLNVSNLRQQLTIWLVVDWNFVASTQTKNKALPRSTFQKEHSASESDIAVPVAWNLIWSKIKEPRKHPIGLEFRIGVPVHRTNRSRHDMTYPQFSESWSDSAWPTRRACLPSLASLWKVDECSGRTPFRCLFILRLHEIHDTGY